MDRWGLGWDKENGVERDRHQSGLTKRYKEIEVDTIRDRKKYRWIYEELTDIKKRG